MFVLITLLSLHSGVSGASSTSTSSTLDTTSASVTNTSTFVTSASTSGTSSSTSVTNTSTSGKSTSSFNTSSVSTTPSNSTESTKAPANNPDHSLAIGLGVGIPLGVLAIAAVTGIIIFAIKRKRSLNEENASIGKTNVTKVQSNNKSVIKELVITKGVPKIIGSRTPDNIYYNVEMEDKTNCSTSTEEYYNVEMEDKTNCSTSTEEYYNVAIKPKDGLNNHSIHRPDGTAESQYASLDISTNSEHLYTGFKI